MFSLRGAPNTDEKLSIYPCLIALLPLAKLKTLYLAILVFNNKLQNSYPACESIRFWTAGGGGDGRLA